MRDYLWDIKGPTNIDALIKEYFAENGYDFDSETGDDYEDGDDYRYGYFWPAKEIDHTPVDQMEGDGHVHMFVREEGKYKQL